MPEDSPFLDRAPIDTPRALRLLAEGSVEVRGRMPYSSNATFLVDMKHDGLIAQAIYKPLRGEQTLWDFPDGLYQREVATFHISESLGWDLVPPTIARTDLPAGIGSLQLYVPCRFEEHYFTLHEAGPGHDDEFRRICALDLVINNTDRKSGHCLLGTDGRVHAIDHGVALHEDFKLRTVIWDFVGEMLPVADIRDLSSFVDRGLPAAAAVLLGPNERDAVISRTTDLLESGRFPDDETGGRRWPWPLI